jgi:hypothetical protein
LVFVERTHFVKKKFAVALLIAIASVSLLSTGVALAAPGGYGPAAPTGPAGTPGGFAAVVITQTVGPAGGTIAADVSGASVSVIVPAGAFASPVQLEVTKPDLSAITPSALSSVGFPAYTAVAGLGLKFLDSAGKPLTGSFAKAVDVTLTGSNLGVTGEKVVELQGATAASVVGSSLGAGAITVHLLQDPNLVVVNPTASGTGSSSGTVPGATDQPTGKPFTGETDAAIGLLVVGAGGLFAGLRRRATSR